jgi:SAM-dependent methyltransferase
VVNGQLSDVDPATLARFAGIIQEDGHDFLDRYLWSQRRFFEGVDLKGRSVLEVGSGRGLTSIYAALAGARAVVSMEPGLAGAKSQVRETLERRLSTLGLPQVELLAEDFNTWDSKGRCFDVIVSQASINHLCESPHHALAHRPTFDRYLGAARKMHGLLAPGGVACVSDACRYGFFMFAKHLGLKRPWNARRLTVNWRIHQNPGTWKRIFTDAGFSRIEVSYPLPFRLRRLGVLVSNPLSNFFLGAGFRLAARRD